MKDQIAHLVEENWAQRVPALLSLVADTTRQIENFLVLEDYYRAARKEENQLRKSFGSFGSEALDIKSLSTVLQSSYDARSMQKERFRRIQKIFQELEQLKKTYQQQPPKCGFADMQQGTEAIFRAFEEHIAALTRTFRLLRIARLEARGKYDPRTHDETFEKFNWRNLDSAEMELCPPFVVFASPKTDAGEYLGELLELLTSGKPIKVSILQSSLYSGVPETGRAAALKGAGDVTLLFLSLRNVYFLQSVVAGQTALSEHMARGLESPRPGVFSFLVNGAPPGDGSEARARRAMTSRAFPQFVYDPDKASEFVSCLNLSDNPDLEEMWPKTTLEYPGEDGEAVQLEHRFTFADFAAMENDFREQFTSLSGDTPEELAVPLADYLEQSPEERRGKTPYITVVDENRHPARWVPSQAMIAQTADRMHLWHTLQELGGIKNPFVQAAEQRIKEQLSAERDQSLSEQKARLEAQLKAREQDAVAQAMKNLAMRLTGMSVTGSAPAMTAPVGVPAPAAPAPAPEPPAAAEAPAEEAEAPPSEQAWIDERLCTSCDECITINKKLFAYHPNKKAYITDPKAGPYKDIVRAAEKCSSGAIHPGLPLDPNEKDVDKWIKRGEKFQ